MKRVPAKSALPVAAASVVVVVVAVETVAAVVVAVAVADIAIVANSNLFAKPPFHWDGGFFYSTNLPGFNIPAGSRAYLTFR